MTRRAAAALLVAFLALLVITAAAKGHRRHVGHGQVGFDGHGPEFWWGRWRREHRTTLTLRRHLAGRLDRLVYLVDGFLCIHSHEGAWGSNTGNGFYGGLQFGLREWRRYGGQFAGRADLATPAEQITAGISYHADRGFAPWPATSRMCGLR